MKERLHAVPHILDQEPAVTITPELARKVIVAAELQGGIDNAVRTYLDGVIAGQSRNEIRLQLGSTDLYNDVSRRVEAFVRNEGIL